jgi:SAM-dependent methyltransferase
MDDNGQKFGFGKNWDEFVRRAFSEERVRIAREHILRFLELPDLKGKYFLDVGCGSGLSSRAALDAGAERIVSFDCDPDSVRTTERVRQMSGNPPNWTVLQGSVLDEPFVASLEPADIVYSWGVLHHTGRMWKAIENAAGLMRAGGLFYIALYTTTPKSDYWIRIKKKYNGSSAFRKRLMEARHILRHTIFPQLIHGRNPRRLIKNYKSARGMSYFTDVKDWLGGWPYEDAKIEEVLRFCRERLGLELINIATGEANTEYLFKVRE